MDLDALDKALAEKVMGWQPSDYVDNLGGLGPVHWVGRAYVDAEGTRMAEVADWHPTRLRDHAMQVLEHEKLELGFGGSLWECTAYETRYGELEEFIAKHTDPKLAICLAAAQKYGIEVQ